IDDVGAFGEADVVDEDVEPTKGLDGAHEDVRHSLVGREVGLNCEHALGRARQRPQALYRLGDALLAACANGDAAALLDELGGNGETEAPGRASDDGDLAV